MPYHLLRATQSLSNLIQRFLELEVFSVLDRFGEGLFEQVARLFEVLDGVVVLFDGATFLGTPFCSTRPSATIKEIGDSALAEHIVAQAQRRGKTFRQQALEALGSIKHDCVRKFCLTGLKKTRDLTERGALYNCLAKLADEASVGVLERGEDHARTSEESRLLADIDRREGEERDDMLSFLEGFWNSSS